MIVPEYKTVSVRLEWSVICKLACKAMIHGTDFEMMCQLAIADRLKKRTKP